MKILLDENLPHAIRNELPGHNICTASYMGWSGVDNGKLLALAAGAGFEVFLTNDRGLEYEQNPASLPIAVIVLLVKRNTISAIRPLYPQIQQALSALQPGELRKVSP